MSMVKQFKGIYRSDADGHIIGLSTFKDDHYYGVIQDGIIYYSGLGWNVIETYKGSDIKNGCLKRSAWAYVDFGTKKKSIKLTEHYLDSINKWIGCSETSLINGIVEHKEWKKGKLVEHLVYQR